MSKKREDLSGRKFERLTVVSISHVDKHKNWHWNCRCECGKETVVNGSSLRSGSTKSCGCLVGELTVKRNTKHGRCKTKEHSIWISMKQRFLNEKSKSFKNYGGRGIKVCERWLKFENFFADMGEKPHGKTLERIDNDGNYEPENCRWATYTEQERNKRNTLTLTIDGETKTFMEWVEEFQVPVARVWYRIFRAGWDAKRAFTTPKIC